MCEFVDKIGFTPVEPIASKFINSHVETPADLQPAGVLFDGAQGGSRLAPGGRVAARFTDE